MKIEKKIFLILFSIFLVFNLATVSGYGVTWDEAAQHHIGQVTKDFMTGQTRRLEFARPDQIYYGPAFEILNQYFGRWMINLGFGYADAFHILILLAAAFGIFFSFKLTELLFGGRVALWSLILLMMYPRFVAHAHYNSKDIPLFAFFTPTLYFLHKAFIGGNKKSLWPAGILLGLGIATRMDMILVLPVFFIPYVVTLFLPYRSPILTYWPVLKQNIFSIFKLLVAAGATIFVFWPMMWQNPKILVDSFAYFTNHGWNNPVLYFGQIYNAKDLPWHYAPFFIFATMPVAIIVFFAAGSVLAFKKIRENLFGLLLVGFWIGLRLALAFLPNASRYDGVRHYLFIIPAFLIIAAIGFDYFFERSKKIAAAAGIVAAAMIIYEFTAIFPFGDSYFNEPTRLAFAGRMNQNFEVEYWGSPYRQGADWINKNADLNSEICVPLGDHLMQFYKIRTDIKIGCGPGADYIMAVPRESFFPPDLKGVLAGDNVKKVFAISRFGYDILTIYKISTPL